MSFFGSIGYIMAGSGLNKGLSICYAPVSVQNMLTGHAYARAVRGFTLVYAALCKKIFCEIQFSEEERSHMETIIELFTYGPHNYETVQESTLLNTINEKFIEKMAEIEKRGNTAKLWIQYVRMVAIAKSLMRAEKMGNLKLQLLCIKQMLPYFHAAGHYNYAKSAHLYVQEMQEYIHEMDQLRSSVENSDVEINESIASMIKEYENFVNNGYCTVGRHNQPVSYTHLRQSNKK